ncbi:MAG: YciC family protein [Solirubrobacterales bacterium]
MSAVGGTGGQLDIGGVFDATTEIYKKSFSTVWIVALILMVPTAIIVGLLGDRGLLSLIGSLVQLVATAWLAGSIIRVVQDVEADGRVDLSVGDILGSVTGKLVAIILLEIVVGILVGIGLIFCIIPGVFLMLMWAVSIPSMVVEDLGVFDSMSRSSDLTKDNRMRILGVIALILIAYIVVALIAGLLIAAVPVLGIIALIIVGILVYPYISIIAAVLYFRLRELKDGAVAAVDEAVVVEETINPIDPPPAV